MASIMRLGRMRARRSAARRSGARRLLTAVAAVTLLALVCSGASFAKHATTGPGSRLDIYFIITDQKVSLAIYSLSDYAGQSELYLEQPQAVVRGDVARIDVVNRGKKSHSFVLMGRKTKTLKPGTKTRFTLALLHRGSFPYHANTPGRTALLKGTFTVY